MAFRRAQTTESDPGEWVLYGHEVAKDKDGKDIRTAVEFRIRRLLPKVAAKIEEKHGVANRRLILVGSQRPKDGARKGDQMLAPTDTAAEIAAGVEKAVLCLADSRNCVVEPVAPEDAAVYDAALGVEPGTVKAGEPLTLDGKWGRRELREQFLSDEITVAGWIVRKALALGVKVAQEQAEEEEGKDEG